MYRFNSGGCCCCCYCDNSDVLLLVDTTGSMANNLGFLTSTFSEIRETYPSHNCRWSLAEYRTVGVFSAGWNILQTFTTDFSQFVDAVELLDATGSSGQVLMALKNAGDLWVSGLEGSTDPDRKRVIVWVGDFAGFNGTSPYPTRQEAIDSLIAANIRVVAINVDRVNEGIDGSLAVENALNKRPGQATDVIQQTGGTVFHAGLGSIVAVKTALCRAFSDRPTRLHGEIRG